MIPVVGGALAERWNYAQERDRQRVKQMGEAARDEVTDDERFIRRVRRTTTLDILVEAAEAARCTSWGEADHHGTRPRPLCVTTPALTNPPPSLTALAALEAPHFHWMAKIAAESPPQAPLSGHPVPEPYNSQLIAQGVVQLASPYGGVDEIVGLSVFGTHLLTWVRAADQP